MIEDLLYFPEDCIDFLIDLIDSFWFSWGERRQPLQRRNREATKSRRANMTDFQIVEKGVKFDIKDKSGAAINHLYVGAGWDFPGTPVDLDLVAALLTNGKITKSTNLVYFGNRHVTGAELSEDNTTGEGDGDDENMKIDFSKIDTTVDAIAIGICAYAGADLATAQNVHLRGVNGTQETDPQVFQAPMQTATSNDTVLHAVTLHRTSTGWTVENINHFAKKGNGRAAIEGFANMFQ